MTSWTCAWGHALVWRLLPDYGYAFQCRYVLHIIDTDPLSLSANGWLEDTSKVQKYEMSDQAYAERENTYRKFKKQRLKVCGF